MHPGVKEIRISRTESEIYVFTPETWSKLVTNLVDISLKIYIKKKEEEEIIVVYKNTQ